MKSVYKTYVCVFCTVRISKSSAGAISPIHVPASLYFRILYKIHVFGFMSQHLCVSGSSARSMCLDSCLSMHVYLRILCKIHVSGSISQQPYVSQDPLQDPRLRIHVSASLYLTDSLQDPCLRIHVSASLYLRILCKIHVSGSMCPAHVLASTNMDPLQDPCLRIHVPASLYFRILYKIHVFGFMSHHPLVWSLYNIHVFGFMPQHLCISGSSARSMSPDSCLSIHMYLRLLCKIHVSGSIYQHPYVSQDPLSPIHVSASLCLRLLCKIHVSGFMSQHACVSQDPLQDPCLRILCKIHVLASANMDPLRHPCMSPGSCLSICVSRFSIRSMSSD